MSDEQPPAETVDEPKAKPAKKATSSKRGDPWEEPCPVCGLLGCRRHT
jgi:hypothetical protein